MIITNPELKTLLTAYTAGTANPQINLADNTYNTATEADINKIRKIMKAYCSVFKFVPEKRDCDDYAIVAAAVRSTICPGAAFGVIWAAGISDGGNHAANIYIDDANRVRLFEPQNGEEITKTPTGNILIII